MIREDGISSVGNSRIGFLGLGSGDLTPCELVVSLPLLQFRLYVELGAPFHQPLLSGIGPVLALLVGLSGMVAATRASIDS